MYYYRARYYDPQLGRFVSQDPIGFAAEDANLYRYVENKSVTHVDPNGLQQTYAIWVEFGGSTDFIGHQKISIGDPTGVGPKLSVSFGMDTSIDLGWDIPLVDVFPPRIEGGIYDDSGHGGEIDPTRYREISQAEFEHLVKVLNDAINRQELEGEREAYIPDTCISFTCMMWDAIEDAGIGTPATPPGVKTKG